MRKVKAPMGNFVHRNEEFGGDFDAAAAAAAKEFPGLNVNGRVLAEWIAKWYLAAGHKRLNRQILAALKTA